MGQLDSQRIEQTSKEFGGRAGRPCHDAEGRPRWSRGFTFKPNGTRAWEYDGSLRIGPHWRNRSDGTKGSWDVQPLRPKAKEGSRDHRANH